METDEQVQREPQHTDSENSQDGDDDGHVNSLTSFLHRIRQLPQQKQQQLISTSAQIVRNTGTTNGTNNNANHQQAYIPHPQQVENDLTAAREKAFEVVYGSVKERSIRVEKQGMCFVVDAHDRRVRIVSKEEFQKQQQPRLVHIEDLPEEEFSRFGRIFPEDRTENTDRFVHCESCNKYYDFCCREHPLYQCHDREPAVGASNSPSKEADRAALTLPAFLYIHESQIPNAGKGVFTKVDIPIGVVFGPYEGILLQEAKKASQDGYSWELRTGNGKPSYYIDAKDPRYSNWMRYINSPRHENEQNLIAFQYRGSVFYRVYRPIDKNTELLVWYGRSFGRDLGIINVPCIKKKPFVYYSGKNPFVL